MIKRPVYTFSFTEKELKVLMAAVGGSTPGSVEAVLFKSEANKKRLMESISQVKSSIKTTQEVHDGGYNNCMFDRS